MNNLEKKLIDNKAMATNIQIELFEDVIEEIIEEKEIDDILILVKGFDNDTEDEEVMFGLVHAIDEYDGIFGMEKCASYLLNGFKYMANNNADYWIDIFMIRILNSDEARVAYENVIDSKGVVIKSIVRNSIDRLVEDDKEEFYSKSRLLYSKT